MAGRVKKKQRSLADFSAAYGLPHHLDHDPKPVTVVLKFASKDALRGWYDSPEYREIINLRTDNSEGTLVFADGFVMPG